MAEAPKLSVLMITYNHEKYIERAIRSVMMQETYYGYRLIIGEDCSVDGTRQIVQRLQEEFPDKIETIFQTDNVGMVRNFAAVYQAISSEYIAFLEGDDYWTSPYKLDKQIKYMDMHPECRISFHHCSIVNENDKLLTKQKYSKEVWTLQEHLKNDFIINASAVARVNQIPLPYWLYRLQASVDWPLYTWLLLHGGDAHRFSDEDMATYRMHPGGVTHVLRDKRPEMYEKRKARLLAGLNDIHVVKGQIPFAQRKYLRARAYRRYFLLARLSIEESAYSDARKYYLQSLLRLPAVAEKTEMKKSFKMFLHLYLGLLPAERVAY